MKKLLSTLLINLIIFITALSFLILSYSYFVIPYKIFREGGVNQRVITKGDPLFLFDDKLGVIANKNLKSERIHQNIGLKYKVITDQNGQRISDLPNKKKYLNHTIVAVGGSFTWGHGINNEQKFISILENKLNTGIKNFALDGYGSLQSYITLKKYKNSAKLIIYGFIDDHLNRNVSVCSHTHGIYCIHAPVATINENGNFIFTQQLKKNNVIKMQKYTNRLASEKLFALENFNLGFSFLKDSLFRRLGLYENKYSESEKLIIGKHIIEQMNYEAKKKGAKLLIVHLGIGQPNINFKKISNMTFDENVYFFDSTEFTNYKIKDLVIENNKHPNAIANKEFAEKIYKFIIEKKLIN